MLQCMGLQRVGNVRNSRVREAWAVLVEGLERLLGTAQELPEGAGVSSGHGGEGSAEFSVSITLQSEEEPNPLTIEIFQLPCMIQVSPVFWSSMSKRVGLSWYGCSCWGPSLTCGSRDST